MPANLEWVGSETDDTVEVGDDGHALIWDDALWESYKRNAKSIRNQRSECVTPRGVLKKMYCMVYGNFPTDKIVDNANGDFDWFFQKGNVYSDSDKSMFSKYVNLHLGRAWDAMTPQEYHEFTKTQESKTETRTETTYAKPAI